MENKPNIPQLEQDIATLQPQITREIESADKLKELEKKSREKEQHDLLQLQRLKDEQEDLIVDYGLGKRPLSDVATNKRTIREIEERLPDYEVIYSGIGRKVLHHRQTARILAVDLQEKQANLAYERAKLNFGQKLIEGKLSKQDIGWLKSAAGQAEKGAEAEEIIAQSLKRRPS